MGRARQAKGVQLHHGDALAVLATLAEASVDAIVTDPPYGLGFMGRAWDSSGITYNVELWQHCLRVLKPGGHLLAFGGTRTYHRLTCTIEDAGFEIRDSIVWLYGSGFPKSLDVSKAIDRAAGAQREIVGRRDRYRDGIERRNLGDRNEVYGEGLTANGVDTITAPATDDATRWSGWGTALKPAHEPIVVARKPLSGTVAANVLAHGTGALNIDGCRVGDGEGVVTFDRLAGDRSREDYRTGTVTNVHPSTAGRWPSNVVLDEYAAAELDQQSGILHSHPGTMRRDSVIGGYNGLSSRQAGTVLTHAEHGGASRFFPVFHYAAKAPSKERPKVDGVAHPTVKPLSLTRWLVRLVTPPGGIVLDPFVGSGTTAEACIAEGFRCIAIESEASYLPLIVERINRARAPARTKP